MEPQLVKHKESIQGLEVMPSEDQSLLLIALGKLPPKSLYKNTTPDQRMRLEDIKAYFRRDLGQALRAYFAGVPNPVGANNPIYRGFLEQEVEYYLACYNLFWFGWNQIQAEVKAGNIQNVASFPSSPGEALCYVLEEDCQVMLNPCLSREKVSSYESQQLLGGIPDISAKSGKAYKRTLRTLEYGDQALERNASVLEKHESKGFLCFCQSAIKKRLRGNSALRRRLKQFEEIQKARFALIGKILKREGIRGEDWTEGVLRKA